MREDSSKNEMQPTGNRQDSYLKDLQWRASMDMLSGLLNRAATERAIKDRLLEMGQGDTCALFIVDLDNFKQVNDMLGHQAGDQAIRQAAEKLSSLFRASDIVGRLGGDEFVVFLYGGITKEIASKKAAAICEKLQLALGDRETVYITASVGVHIAGKGQTFEGLYQSADLALYKAKKAGKHQFYLKDQEVEQDGELRPASVITLSALLENMESGVALLEMGEVPRIVYVSPSFCRLIGGDSKGFPLPKPLSDLIHPDDLPSVLLVLRDGLQQEQVMEYTHRVHSGEGQPWLWWQIRAARIEYNSDQPMMMVTTTDVSKLKETQQDQADQLRRFQTAFDLTSKRAWEVDLSTRRFRGDILGGDDDPPHGDPSPFPDSLIDNGWIHPDCVARFRRFAHELLNGCAQGFGNFAVRRRDSGCYGWFSLSYRMLFDEVGRAARAVGVLEELPRSFTGGEDWSPDQYRLPQLLVADLVMRMRANLDLDSVEHLWIEGTDFSHQVQDARCSEVLRLEKQHIFCKGDQHQFLTGFDRDALLERYRSGTRWLCAEYRRADRSGSIRWVRHILYLTEEPISRHVYLFVYLIWLDPDHRLERVIRSETARDAVSRLHSQEAVQRMAEALFSDRKSGNRAVAVLQINGVEQLPVGEETDRVLYGISAGLSLVLGGSCLMGRQGADQIVIVFPDVTEKDALRSRLEESLTALRRMLSPESVYRGLRLVAGVDLMPAATANYRFMLAQAVQACASRWNADADAVVFAQEREDWIWTQLHAGQNDRVSIHTTEMSRLLSAPEKDLALDSMSTMLAAKTLDASLSGVLRAIGEYYHADRVYTLMLVESRRAVIITFEWTNGSKRSIQQVVSGTPLEKFPLMIQCMRERSPMFLSRNAAEAAPDGEEGAERPWHFTVFPLARDDHQEVMGFLCVENARKHPADAAVFSTLIPFMLQQRERFSGGANPSALTERLMNIPDLRSYLETLHTINSEYYSSMGAVALDIPGLAAVNNTQGFEYGSRMLWYVANTLTELFGPALSFRVRETEFVAFYPNTTREVFLGCCGRLWSIIQRRYPKQIRIGQAWANEVFTGKHLAEKAERAMRNAHTEHFAQALSALPHIIYDPISGDAAQGGQFIVYFQPKVDMRTGALAGAEALVRRIGEDGAIIPPAQFIPLMEDTGAIRELDLFVLERSLAQAEQWRSAGLGIVPIAVNLSRTTLAHPATLASVLAIQSRYPDIPESALELEITERGDRMSTAELQNFVERFRACGLHMSLDDFGSQYANLSLFTNVKFETVKLDRSLIADLGGNPISRMLVRDLVEICKSCNVTCVAEGVETEEQISALLEMGCVYVQGFYYDHPLPADVFEQKYLRGGVPAKINEAGKE